MVKKKRQSKRLSLHKKYKIIKKVKEHHRKLRKHERVNAGKKPKNPGIPNNWPFKEELMTQLEQERLAEIERAKDLKEKKKEEKAALRQKEKLQNDALTTLPEAIPVELEDQLRQDVKTCIEEADLVLIVLDARDPQGCRPLTFEDGLVGKRQVKVAYVLNKVDLIAPNVAEKWINYLRRYHPTIPVKALNQSIVEVGLKEKAKPVKAKAAIFAKTQQLDGLRDNGNVSALHEFLREFSQGSKKPTQVALMGYPNVGKSTILNSLMEKKCSDPSSRPVKTKTLVRVEYSPTIKLMDSPALDAEYSAPWSQLMRHSMAGTFCVDPVPVVKAVLDRIHKVKVMQMFRLPMFKDHEDFLSKYAIKRSMMRKGGDPNILRAARTFLSSIGNSSVSLSCLPPTYRKDEFKMPKWFEDLNKTKMLKAEKGLLVPLGETKMNFLELSTKNISNPQGDTTEYDVAIGDMSAYIDATSSEDEADSEDGEDEFDSEDSDPKVEQSTKRLRKN